MKRTVLEGLLLVGVVVLVALGGGVGSADTASAVDGDGRIHVENPTLDNVDGDGVTGTNESADGDGVYGSIRAGIDAASDAGRIEVAPGTYRERNVTLDKNLTLVAPRGATLNGSTGDGGAGINVTDPPSTDAGVAPTIDGLVIVGFDDFRSVGIDATGTAGNWTIRNVTIRDSRNGIDAEASTGDWTVRNVTIRESRGIIARSSTGNWTVRDSTFRNSPDYGIGATDSTGDWTVRDSTFLSTDLSATDSIGDWTVRNVRFEDGFTGVAAFGTAGDWEVTNSTIRNTTIGVIAQRSTGDWTVRGSVIRGSSPLPRFESPSEATGVDAVDSRGAWTIRNSTVRDNARNGIDAEASTGDWTVRDSTVRNNSRDGIDAEASTGDWTVRDSTVRGNGLVGIDASESIGAWSLRDGTVRNSTVGVDASGSAGNWTIRRSVVRWSSPAPQFDTRGEGTGVYAVNTEGAWVVSGSAITDNRLHGIDATGAAVAGNATRNYWGGFGPGPRQCVGDVDCSEWSLVPPGRLVASSPVPQDPDGDGRYEDVNGDGGVAPGDATVLFDIVVDGRAAAAGDLSPFDFTGDGTLTRADAVTLFREALAA